MHFAQWLKGVTGKALGPAYSKCLLFPSLCTCVLQQSTKYEWCNPLSHLAVSMFSTSHWPRQLDCAQRTSSLLWRGKALTCNRGERENGRWKGKTSQPCPPSSSRNNSKWLQRIREGAQSIHNQRATDGRNHGKACSLSQPLFSGHTEAPGRNLKRAQHHQICIELSTLGETNIKGRDVQREHDTVGIGTKSCCVLPVHPTYPAIQPQSEFCLAKYLLLWCCWWHRAATGQQCREGGRGCRVEQM